MKQSLAAWLSLVGAAFCEMGWTYSVKFLQVDELKTLRWATFYRLDGGLPILSSWLAYFIFGVVNTVLLALAMRSITTSTAFAVWMALSLIFTKGVDVFWLKSTWTWPELFFMGLILIGVVGLKAVNVT
ncbi:DMT family transporter [Larkinella rosea]|uniref:Quaternary ammonium compound-resistance protein SugE n=1 Tax=Larkinella rosea TaxID=2025312 RepID=A0A3P1BTX2_9BACT|nr:SMR family transporter [Larkinella rosea]RRB04497.1 hypothetical protein EHT25_13460 [Larkinella rosea]